MKEVFLIQMFSFGTESPFKGSKTYIMESPDKYQEFPTRDHAQRFLVKESNDLPKDFYYKIDSVFKHV